jgi:peptidyl-prolyl cis-trans isomerase C
MLQRAREIGLLAAAPADDAAADAAIERLLEREASVPQPTEQECRRFYDANIARYGSGALVEASHILFAVVASAPVEPIRRQAEATLREARAEPQRFAELARSLSNCPSAAQGGSLGQIRRGDTVPEFERALFSGDTGVLPRLVNTRYGFHVVRVERSIPGATLDFEAARARIERTLAERVRSKAAQQYVQVLAARASISGIDLCAVASPLMQ